MVDPIRETEREDEDRMLLLGGSATWKKHGDGLALQAFGLRAIVTQDDGYNVKILQWQTGIWVEIDCDCGHSPKWAKSYAEGKVFEIAKAWEGCDAL